MPAARTAHTRHGSRQPLQPQPSHPGNIVPDIIVLSSDDDEPAPRKPIVKRPPKPRPRAKVRQAPAAPAPQDVVDIVSEEDSPSKDSERELKAQLEKAKRKIAQLEKALAAPDRHSSSAVDNTEVRRLTSEVETAKASKQRLLMCLEDQICCEICTLKMWTPYTLSCGHTFCLGCLQDWFSTILAQHMNTHPGYNPNPPAAAHYRNALRNEVFSEQERRYLQRELQTIYNNMEHPNYTCPSCRVSVKTKPSEAFAIKNVVRAVAEAQGEASPRRRATHNARRSDPWDGFFPAVLTQP